MSNAVNLTILVNLTTDLYVQTFLQVGDAPIVYKYITLVHVKHVNLYALLIA